MNNTLNEKLMKFIDQSPSCYHAADNLIRRLEGMGYVRLLEQEQWNLEAGGKYYFVKNGSTLIAFRIPAELTGGFMLSAAHSDFPSFKLKANPEKHAEHYLLLNTEEYGGTLMSTWTDRPLSVAGRLIVRQEGGLAARLVNIDRDTAVIPNLAIHMNRKANEGTEYKANVDMLPLLSQGRGGILELAARYAGVRREDVAEYELYMYCRQRGTLIGAEEEYLLSPRIDDLECAFCCMEGFLRASDSGAIPLCCTFDNEEVGSATKQGAASSLLRDTLRRITLSLGMGYEQHLAMLSRSYMVSADNAHAMHPNHPEYSDAQNCPYMNGGVVIKYNADQKYTTDGLSAALFRELCNEAGVAVQVYANRSDLPGGSTLGSKANTQVPVMTVDIGLAQLAMHSACETAGAQDPDSLVRAMTAFFSTALTVSEQGVHMLRRRQ